MCVTFVGEVPHNFPMRRAGGVVRHVYLRVVEKAAPGVEPSVAHPHHLALSGDVDGDGLQRLAQITPGLTGPPRISIRRSHREQGLNPNHIWVKG